MARLLRHVAARLERRAARLGDGPWLAGVSGGPDSMLLLWLLAELWRRQGLPRRIPQPIAATIDHGLRPESADEAAAVASFAASLGVPSRQLRVAPAGRGETAARAARFVAFERLLAQEGASALLLAHHADDNLETVIFRLMRGTGPLGLAGIPELRPLGTGGRPLVRPLLAVPRRVLQEAFTALGLPAYEDPTNALPEHTPRNRIRHEILPRLRTADPSDARLAGLVREARALRRAVRRELASTSPLRKDANTLELALEPLRGLSPWARELLFVKVIEDLGHPRPLRKTLRRLGDLLAADRRTGAAVEARGRWQARRTRTSIEFASGTGGR